MVNGRFNYLSSSIVTSEKVKLSLNFASMDIASDGPEIRFSDKRNDYFRRHYLITVNDTSWTCLCTCDRLYQLQLPTSFTIVRETTYAIFETCRKVGLTLRLREEAVLSQCGALISLPLLQRYIEIYASQYIRNRRTNATHPFNYKTQIVRNIARVTRERSITVTCFNLVYLESVQFKLLRFNENS